MTRSLNAMYIEYSEAKELLVALKSLIVRALSDIIFSLKLTMSTRYLSLRVFPLVFPFRYSNRTYNID